MNQKEKEFKKLENKIIQIKNRHCNNCTIKKFNPDYVSMCGNIQCEIQNKLENLFIEYRKY